MRAILKEWEDLKHFMSNSKFRLNAIRRELNKATRKGFGRVIVESGGIYISNGEELSKSEAEKLQEVSNTICIKITSEQAYYAV